jgi:phosphopantothenoylcysteine decarboxylase / phosphopantothenate---cysteine ligase
MAEAVWRRFNAADICIMAAAVCDFRPKTMAGNKIKKGSFTSALELEPTPDILAELGRRKKSQVLVGFAVETEKVEDHAREKVAVKRLDFIVANDATAFDAETNRAVFITGDGKVERLPEMRKIELAKAIIERAVGLVRR